MGGQGRGGAVVSGVPPPPLPVSSFSKKADTPPYPAGDIVEVEGGPPQLDVSNFQHFPVQVSGTVV